MGDTYNIPTNSINIYLTTVKQSQKALKYKENVENIPTKRTFGQKLLRLVPSPIQEKSLIKISLEIAEGFPIFILFSSFAIISKDVARPRIEYFFNDVYGPLGCLRVSSGDAVFEILYKTCLNSRSVFE